MAIKAWTRYRVQTARDAAMSDIVEDGAAQYAAYMMTQAQQVTATFTLQPTHGEPEPNDTCEQAVVIPTDGTAHTYAFQDDGDIDWVKFYATAGYTYVVEARVPATSTADVILEMHETCGSSGGSFDDDDPAFNPDIRHWIWTPGWMRWGQMCP